MEEEKPSEPHQEGEMAEEPQAEGEEGAHKKNDQELAKWNFYQEMMTKFKEVDKIKESHHEEITKLTKDSSNKSLS